MKEQYATVFNKLLENEFADATGTDLVDIGMSFTILGLDNHVKDEGYTKAIQEAKVVADAMRLLAQGLVQMKVMEEMLGRERFRELIESHKDEIEARFEALQRLRAHCEKRNTSG